MKKTNLCFWVTVFLIFLILTSCGTPKPISTVTAQVPVPTLKSKTTVLILHPHIAFERLHDEMPLEAKAYQGEAIEARLVSKAEFMLKERKIKIEDPNIRNIILTSNLPTEIRKKLPKLSKGITDKESIVLLQSLASYDENMAVLVNFVDAKVGTEGGLDPITGIVILDNSRTLFRSALFQCATGQLLWKDEVLLRELPTLLSKRFKETLDLLFMNFPQKEGQA